MLPERAIITLGVAPLWSSSGDDASSVLEHAAAALRLTDTAAERVNVGVENPVGAWPGWQRD
jgi:hypothetical protein